MQADLKSVVATVGDLPPMPAVAVKVMELLQDPESTADGLANAISADPAVSARILKIANSSFYGLQRQVSTLKAAIVILGQKTLRSLVLAASLTGMHRKYGLQEKMLWEDSVGAAIAGRLLAQHLRSIDPEEAFLAGLFRHIGKVVRSNNNNEEFTNIIQAVYNGEGTFSVLEKDYFPHNHAVVGAAVLDKWNFASALVQSTLHHEDMDIDPDEDAAAYRLTAAINLAGAMCRKLGIGQRSPEEDLDLSETAGAKALGMTQEELDELVADFEKVYAENRGLFVS